MILKFTKDAQTKYINVQSLTGTTPAIIKQLEEAGFVLEQEKPEQIAEIPAKPKKKTLKK